MGSVIRVVRKVEIAMALSPDQLSGAPRPDVFSMAAEGIPAPLAGAARPSSRQPFGSQEQKLAWPPMPGFRLFWFNDEPGRVARALAAGYEHVRDGASGAPVTRIVGRGSTGAGLLGYLMCIPMEWYQEDMARSQAERDRALNEIKAGRPVAAAGENQYIPRQGIKIQQERR